MVSLLTAHSRVERKSLAAQSGGTVIMEEQQIATIGSFCLNEECEDYKGINRNNVVKCGKTETGVQRYRCKTCKKPFTETKGTMFYRCRHTEEEIIECMAMLGDRNSLAAIHRIKGIKEETVCQWLELASAHINQFEEYSVKNHKLSRVQLDALWTYVGHKGEKGEK
jgi:transposase-like protein